MSNAKISSRDLTLSELLHTYNGQYTIPDFQRDFVWGADELEALMNDFREDSQNFEIDPNELEGYLLGNIVVINDGKNDIVIDGQQRLTTLTIILKAFNVFATKKLEQDNVKNREQWDGLRIRSRDGFALYGTMGDFIDLIIKHDSSLSYGKYYRKLMQGDLEVLDEPESEAENNLKNIFETILNNFEDEDFTDEKIFTFYKYLVDNVSIIKTSAPNENKAFQLFEVLNDRGRSLEPLDLIKNLFLKVISKQTDNTYKEHFLDNWREFNDNLELPRKMDGRKSKISSSKFLSNYILAFDGQNVKKNKLFNYYKELQNKLSAKEIVELSKNYKDVARIFANLELGNFNTFLSDSDDIKILYNVLSNEQSKTMLMPFYYLESDTDKKRIVDAITRFIASTHYSFKQGNTVESFIPVVVKKYFETKSIDQVVEVIDKRTSENVNDLNNVLPTRIVRDNKAKDLYRFIEAYFFKNSKIINHKGRTTQVTLEHILPRNHKSYYLKGVGFNDEEDFEKHINQIGNLAIISGSSNSSMKDKTFEQKREHFWTDGEFILTKKLSRDLSTRIKSGENKELVETVNNYITTPKKEVQYFGKDLISKRSEEVTNFLADILTKAI